MESHYNQQLFCSFHLLGKNHPGLCENVCVCVWVAGCVGGWERERERERIAMTSEPKFDNPVFLLLNPSTFQEIFSTNIFFSKLFSWAKHQSRSSRFKIWAFVVHCSLGSKRLQVLIPITEGHLNLRLLVNLKIYSGLVSGTIRTTYESDE